MSLQDPIVFEAACAALRALPRGRAGAAELQAFRAAVRAGLAAAGFDLPDVVAPGPTCALLAVASGYSGGIGLFCLDDGLPAPLVAAVGALDGASFQRLEDLADDERGHALRLLAATRATGLGPDELAGWAAEAGATGAPDEAELDALAAGEQPRFVAERADRQPAVTTPELPAFDRVHVVRYDGP